MSLSCSAIWNINCFTSECMNLYPFPFLHLYQRFKYPLTYYILYLLVAQWRSENMWLFPVALMIAAPLGLIRVSRRGRYVYSKWINRMQHRLPFLVCNWPINVHCPQSLPQCMLYEIGFDLTKWNIEGLLSRSMHFLCQINVFESLYPSNTTRMLLRNGLPSSELLLWWGFPASFLNEYYWAQQCVDLILNVQFQLRCSDYYNEHLHRHYHKRATETVRWPI